MFNDNTVAQGSLERVNPLRTVLLLTDNCPLGTVRCSVITHTKQWIQPSPAGCRGRNVQRTHGRREGGTWAVLGNAAIPVSGSPQ